MQAVNSSHAAIWLKSKPAIPAWIGGFLDIVDAQCALLVGNMALLKAVRVSIECVYLLSS